MAGYILYAAVGLAALIVGGVDAVSQGYIVALDAGTGQEMWRFVPSGDAETQRYVDRPVSSDWMVLFLKSFPSFARNPVEGIYALDGGTGKQIWKYKPKGWNGTRLLAASHGLVYAASAEYDGYLYDGKMSMPVDSPSLVALDQKTGQEVWSFQAGASLTAASVSNDKLFVVSNDNGASTVHMLDAQSGRELSNFQLEGVALGPPVVAEGAVYVVTRTYTNYFLNAVR